MSDSKNKKKDLLKSMGLPVDKLPEDKLDQFMDSIDDGFIKNKSIDFDSLLDKFDLGSLVQNILTTDNSDIVNLLKQLEKLRKKNKAK